MDIRQHKNAHSGFFVDITILRVEFVLSGLVVGFYREARTKKKMEITTTLSET